MNWLIDLLTYQSDAQRYGSVFGGAMLGFSAVVIFACMVRIKRKPRLDQALTVKQFALIFLGTRLAAANLLHRPSEMWGTLVIVGVGVASLGVMVETIRARRTPEEGWEDPYAVIEELRADLAQLRALNAELTRRLGMAVEIQ